MAQEQAPTTETPTTTETPPATTTDSSNQQTTTPSPETTQSEEEKLLAAAQESGDADELFDEVDDNFLKAKPAEAAAIAAELAESAPAATPPPAAAPAAATQPAPTAPAATAPAAAAPVTTQPAETPVAQTTEPAALQAQVDPRAAYEEYRSGALTKLEPYFQISKEDAEQLIESPETVVPKLMARVMFESTTLAAQAIMAQLPVVLEHLEGQRNGNKQREDAFFGAWPQLREHAPAVMQHARLYKSMHPQSTLEETIQHVGAAVMIALKLPLEAQGTPAPAQSGTVPVPTAAPIPPHRPAAASAPRVQAPVQTNAYAAMADDDIADRFGTQ